MKKRKYLAIFLALTMLLTMLTACGGEEQPESSGPDETPTPVEEDVNIVYWSMWNEAEPQALVISNAIEAFEEETGITVEAVFNGRDTKKTLQPAIDAGTQVDIFDYDIDWLHQNWGDYTLVIEDYVKEAYPSTDGKALEDCLNGLMMDLARTMGPDGQLDCVPYQPSAVMVMYNKTLFAEAGITTVPQTWDEFLGICQQLKDAGIVPMTVDNAYMALPFGAYLARLIGQDGIDKLVADKTWDTPEVREAAAAWKEFADLGYISDKATTNVYPAGQQEIAAGEAAMYLNGTFLPNEVKNAVVEDLEWGAFAFPAVEGGICGTEANYYGSQCFAVSNKSEYPEEAMQFIAYMTSGEWDETLAIESMGVPMAEGSTWPAELADAKVAFDNTTTRLKNNFGLHVDADRYPIMKESMTRLFSGEYSVDDFVKAISG